MSSHLQEKGNEDITQLLHWTGNGSDVNHQDSLITYSRAYFTARLEVEARVTDDHLVFRN